MARAPAPSGSRGRSESSTRSWKAKRSTKLLSTVPYSHIAVHIVYLDDLRRFRASPFVVTIQGRYILISTGGRLSSMPCGHSAVSSRSTGDGSSFTSGPTPPASAMPRHQLDELSNRGGRVGLVTQLNRPSRGPDRTHKAWPPILRRPAIDVGIVGPGRQAAFEASLPFVHGSRWTSGPRSGSSKVPACTWMVHGAPTWLLPNSQSSP